MRPPFSDPGSAPEKRGGSKYMQTFLKITYCQDNPSYPIRSDRQIPV